MEAEDVRRLFLRALDVEPAAQAEFLAGSGSPPEVQRAVLTLLRYDEGAESLFQQSLSRELLPESFIEQRFGPYRLRQLLGRGGMGAVFKAERVDGELSQIVAIKIVERGWLDPRAYERFRQERQILAGLEHPNIAPLLDGGTREDGLPYLVMEYVDGLRLDQYCAQHGLGITERLRVFLPLCDAVEYAHRKLIVHRDLKPSNVLVTTGGVPKLLDFGVAKAVDPGASGRTQTLVLTPDFSSPEQARGDEVTTATDVYGLGAVLYHLLTGRPPNPVEGLSPRELEHAICEVGPSRPSLHHPDLKGDLENILLKALRLDPAARYASARELAEDIERFLERRPVQATPQRWWYRTRRFVQRHALATAAACLAGAAILAGVGVSIYEARRAQHRFNQVRELANRSIFDFEKSIRDVPGTLAARQKMAATARSYLANLAGDAQGDATLTRELAESHFLLSRAEYSAGQSEAALRDLQESAALLHAVRDDCCGQPVQRLLYIRVLADLARCRLDARDGGGARTISRDALRQAREWTKTAPGQDEARRALMTALASDGMLAQAQGNPTESQLLLRESTEVGARLVRENPADEELAYQQARSQYLLANLERDLQHGEATRDAAEQSKLILDQLLDKHPENGRWQQLRVMAVSTVADGLHYMAAQNPALEIQSLESARLAYQLAKTNAERNTGDKNWADQFAVTTTRLAAALQENRRGREAVPLLQEAGATIDRLVIADTKNRRPRYLRANNRLLVSELLIDQNALADADVVLNEADRDIDELLKEAPDDFHTAHNRLAVLANHVVVDYRLGNLDRARGHCRSGLDLAASFIRRDPALKDSLTGLNKLRRHASLLGIADPTLAAAGNPR
jgi:eukaryotic-like serine/threonine-protein kinase